MTERKPGRPRGSRDGLGHSETLSIKLHPDLMAFILQQAKADYTSPPEFVRRLIIAAMRAEEARPEPAL
jgi:hypothetical protein